MPVLRELRELFADTVTVKPRSGKDVNDQSTFGAAVTYTARVEGQIKLVTDEHGKERVSTVQVWLDRLVSTLTVRDELTLPSRFSPQKPQIIAVRHEVDEIGTSGTMSHSVIYA